MRIGVIADDFTGASDIALTLALGGMSTVQYVGVPESKAVEADAGVIALKSRTIVAADAVAQSLAACDWLLAQGATQIFFKVCSTFDSTPDGNIGPVAAALAARLGETHVFVCPAFPENGRSVYQGHLFVNDTLLNASGMQDHPLTPMRDSNLVRVLGRQTRLPVGMIDIATIARGAAEVRKAFDAARAAGIPIVVVDTLDNADLMTIGAACRDMRLITGGSGRITGNFAPDEAQRIATLIRSGALPAPLTTHR